MQMSKIITLPYVMCRPYYIPPNSAVPEKKKKEREYAYPDRLPICKSFNDAAMPNAYADAW